MQNTDPVNLTYGQLTDFVERVEQIPTLSGAGAPTASTPAFYEGQLYLDTTNNDLYVCTSLPSSGATPYGWEQTDTTYSNFTGTDGTAAGAAGLVPAPATTDAGKYLKSDGTWSSAPGPTIVHTTGNSTTDVMSQWGTTLLVYPYVTDKTSIRIGSGSSSGQSNSVGIGYYVTAVQFGTALGGYSNASANYSVAIGNGNGYGVGNRGASATAISSTAIGPSATASAHSSISLGAFTTAAQNGSVAIGRGATTSAVGEVNIGATGHTSYGYSNSEYRLLTGLYDPQSTHDAATKGYVDASLSTAILNGGTIAPTTATVGAVGTLYSYVDTTGATPVPHMMVCTAIDTTTDPSNPSYTWTEAGAAAITNLTNTQMNNIWNGA